MSRSLLGQSYRVQGEAYYQNKVAAMYDAVARALSPLRLDTAVMLVLSLVALAALSTWRRDPARGTRVRPVFLAVLILESRLPALAHSLLTSPASVLTPPPLAKAISAQQAAGRLYHFVTQDDIIGGTSMTERLRLTTTFLPESRTWGSTARSGKPAIL